MVAAAGAGPKPIARKHLDVQNLTEAIRLCLTPEALAAAQGIALKIQAERGVKRAVESFHEQLQPVTLHCDLLHDQPAVWLYRKRGFRELKLSKLAAEVLIDYLRIDKKDLKL
jgi:hypothetical protein